MKPIDVIIKDKDYILINIVSTDSGIYYIVVSKEDGKIYNVHYTSAIIKVKNIKKIK